MPRKGFTSAYGDVNDRINHKANGYMICMAERLSINVLRMRLERGMSRYAMVQDITRKYGKEVSIKTLIRIERKEVFPNMRTIVILSLYFDIYFPLLFKE